MLGFDVLVYYFDDSGEKQDLAYWSAQWMEWIDELVAENRAVLVEHNMGYPLLYEIAASELLPILSTSDRSELDKRLSRKFTDFPWNSGLRVADDGARIDEEALAACPEDARITVEAWDH